MDTRVSCIFCSGAPPKKSCVSLLVLCLLCERTNEVFIQRKAVHVRELGTPLVLKQHKTAPTSLESRMLDEKTSSIRLSRFADKPYMNAPPLTLICWPVM